MRWTERQQALLRGLGLRLWLPGAPTPTGRAPGAAAAVDAAALALADAGPHALAPAAVAPTRTPAHTPAQTPAQTPTHPPKHQPADAAPVPHAAGLPVDAAALPSRAARAELAATPRQAEVAAMAWPQLQAAVAGCQACGLCSTRRNTVFGVGHRQARVMVVGEAPGEQEDRQGEPFVGAAGQLLDRMLAAIGLARAGDDPANTVYIANTLKCRPPGNRNPSPDELAQCVPYLQRQVALVQPQVILAMGRFAVQALLQSTEPLGRLRGRVHRWQGVPLVVTYHPAYLLRQPADKARSWADLCLAAQVLDSATPSPA